MSSPTRLAQVPPTARRPCRPSQTATSSLALMPARGYAGELVVVRDAGHSGRVDTAAGEVDPRGVVGLPVAAAEVFLSWRYKIALY